MNLSELARQHQVERLIVVTFDQLSQLGPTPTGAAGEVFDELDLACRYYEQHYAQDVRSHQAWKEPFGGTDAFRQLNHDLSSRGMTSALIVVTSQPASNNSLSDTGFFNCRSCEPDAIDLAEIIRDMTQATGSADPPGLLWIHLALGSSGSLSGSDEADRLRWFLSVQQALAMYRRANAEASKSSGLIVTACRGEASTAATAADGTATGVSESLIRIPLWIGLGDDHLMREQDLSGSRMILPMIDQLLQPCVDHADAMVETTDAVVEPAAEVESALTILGDEFVAVRTSQAMAVQRHDRRPDVGEESLLPVQLFLKPEDIWNLQDQADVYSTLRDELAARLPATG